MKVITDYIFPRPLSEGVVISRPNRFIMKVLSNGSVYECHCPATGRIGNIAFDKIACLFSEQSPHRSRRTEYTVEAISLDSLAKKKKSWIGINQYKANDYIEYFIKNGQLSSIISNVGDFRREVKLGKSRIDFLIGDTYLEVKMFLDTLPLNPNTKIKSIRKFISHERITQHYKDLANSQHSSKLLLCFMYNREPLQSMFLPYYNDELRDIVSSATKRGVQTWQVNLQINSQKISFINCRLLSLKPHL